MLTGFDLCRAAVAVVDITAPEQSVLMVLAIMANSDAQCWPPINGDTGLTAKTKLSERAVQRAIQRLKDLGHISRRQLRNGCVYTVHPGAAPSTPATVAGVSETGATETPATQAPRPATVAPKQPVTTKPLKASPPKEARASAIAFVPPSDIPEAEWDAFEQMRIRIKKPMTDGARQLAIARLRKLSDDGWPPGDVLNHSTLNNYQGLFPPKDDRNGKRHHRGSEPIRDSLVAACAADLARHGPS